MWDRAAELGFWMSPSYAPTLWLWALGVLLLLALRRWRTINASALRAFFLLVAFQGLLFLGMNAGAAALAKRLHNPSDFLTAGPPRRGWSRATRAGEHFAINPAKAASASRCQRQLGGAWV
jgi:hypothetical protein